MAHPNPETAKIIEALAEGRSDYVLTTQTSHDLGERQQAAIATLQAALGWSVRVSGNGFPNKGDMTLDLIYVKMHVADVEKFAAQFTPAPPVEVRRMFVDHLRFAIADPGAFLPRDRTKGGSPDSETLANWGARAVLIVVAERDQLRRSLHCSQCGNSLRSPACGPTHAIMDADPWRHKGAPKPDWDKMT